MKKLKKHIPSLLITTFFAVLGTQALLHDGLYSSHDIWHQVARLYHYSEAILDGQFLPTWISNLANGFGYPLFIFSYHLPWMLSIPFTLLGFSIPVTLKILYFLSFLLSGYSMYLFVNSLTKNRLAATTAAITYLWSPYHFLTLFVSAAIGTAYAFVFLPLIFWGVYLIFDKRPRLGSIILSLSLAGAMLSHLMTFVYILPFAILYALYLLYINKNLPTIVLRKKTTLILISIILGFLLSAFYLFPLIKYYPLIKAKEKLGGFADIYANNFVNLKQLIYSKWGFGPIISNAKDGEISFQIGIAQWLGLIALTGAILLQATTSLLQKKLSILKVNFKTSAFFIFAFAISIFGMLDTSKPLWDFATKFISLDYPWRLLLFSVFFGSTIVGLAVASIKPKFLQTLATIAFIAIALYTNKFHIKVNMYTDFPVDLYVISETTTNTFHEYLPTQASENLIHLETQESVFQDVEISNLQTNTTNLSFEIDSKKEQIITLRQFDFPGQMTYLDYELVNHNLDGEGRITLTVPEGIHNVRVSFEETPIIKIGKITSLIAAFIILKMILSKRLNKLKNKRK